MKLTNLITSNVGLIHLIASLLAVFLGTLVLIFKKGTSRHKTIGKLYGYSMGVVLITAFMIYNLFGKWGVFHWSALVSTLTLLGGLIPVYMKRPERGYIVLHYSFMYWSVMGVYGAFISETLVRIPKVVIESGIPNQLFYTMSGIGVATVMGVGLFFFFKLKRKWDDQFVG